MGLRPPHTRGDGGQRDPQHAEWALGTEPWLHPLTPVLSPQRGGVPGVGATSGPGGFEPWGQLLGHDLVGMAEARWDGRQHRGEHWRDTGSSGGTGQHKEDGRCPLGEGAAGERGALPG